MHASEEGRGTAFPRPSRYYKTLRATAFVTLALGALAARSAAAVTAAGGAAGTTVVAAPAGAEADADRQADAQTWRHALLEPLQCGIQVSHTLHLPHVWRMKADCLTRGSVRQSPCLVVTLRLRGNVARALRDRLLVRGRLVREEKCVSRRYGSKESRWDS